METIERGKVLGLYYVENYSVYTGQNMKIGYHHDDFGNLIPASGAQFYHAFYEVCQDMVNELYHEGMN